ncbi:MAG: sugar phosphate isomerase/epimerase family protein [Clostridiaceae bacterium]
MITIYGWFGYNLPMKERYRLIKQAGFNGTIIWWEGSYCSDFRLQPDMARSEGLFVENIHAPYEGITNLWVDNLSGETAAERLIGCVEDCYTHEIPAVIVHPTSGNAPPPNDIGLDRIKRIVDRAKQKVVNVAFENLLRIEFLQYIFEHIDSDRLGFCYDSGHHHSKTPDWDLLAVFGSRLMALHLHDNDGYISGAKEEDQHRMPFDGTINWTAIMRKISETGYNGAVALEVVNGGYENLSAKDFLNIAFESAKRLEELRCRV